jgi:hypothetical protein
MSLPSLSPFLTRKREVFEEIAAARRVGGISSIDLLAIVTSEIPSQCELVFAPGGDAELKSIILPIPTNNELDDLSRGSVEDFSAWFAAWSRSTIEPGAGERILLVKVDEWQSWFLRVPLTLFVRRSLSGLDSYESLSWIVTDRTFADVIQNRSDLIALFEDAEALIRGTVVAINTYPHLRLNADAELVATGTLTAETILGQLQNVPFPDGKVSLRWLKNPSRDEVTEALLNTETKVFVANLETGSGEWELGESPARSEEEYFDLAPLQNRLSHIKLMRVFHCNSIFSRFGAATTGMKPADRSTVVRQLLLTGAQFVEGATMQEPYLEFLAFLFQFLMCGSLTFTLRGRAGSGKFAWADAARVCNQILEVQEFHQRVEDL